MGGRVEGWKGEGGKGGDAPGNTPTGFLVVFGDFFRMS